MIQKFSIKVIFHFEMYFYAIFKGIYTINSFKSKYYKKKGDRTNKILQHYFTKCLGALTCFSH